MAKVKKRREANYQAAKLRRSSAMPVSSSEGENIVSVTACK